MSSFSLSFSFLSTFVPHFSFLPLRFLLFLTPCFLLCHFHFPLTLLSPLSVCPSRLLLLSFSFCLCYVTPFHTHKQTRQFLGTQWPFKEPFVACHTVGRSAGLCVSAKNTFIIIFYFVIGGRLDYKRLLISVNNGSLVDANINRRFLCRFKGEQKHKTKTQREKTNKGREVKSASEFY